MRADLPPRRRPIEGAGLNILLLTSEFAPAMGGIGTYACEIAAAFDVSRTAISQHLTVLKNAGLVTERRDGTRRMYLARPEGLAGLRAFLDELWGSALDTARRLVEADRGLRDTVEEVGRAS